MPHSDILTWISQLHNRVEHNELAGRGPIDFGYGRTTVPIERIVRIMLADLRALDGQTAPRREWAGAMTRRLDLLKAFRRLREQIG
jgi:hypothetical protein